MGNEWAPGVLARVGASGTTQCIKEQNLGNFIRLITAMNPGEDTQWQAGEKWCKGMFVFFLVSYGATPMLPADMTLPQYDIKQHFGIDPDPDKAVPGFPWQKYYLEDPTKVDTSLTPTLGSRGLGRFAFVGMTIQDAEPGGSFGGRGKEYATRVAGITPIPRPFTLIDPDFLSKVLNRTKPLYNRQSLPAVPPRDSNQVDAMFDLCKLGSGGQARLNKDFDLCIEILEGASRKDDVKASIDANWSARQPKVWPWN